MSPPLPVTEDTPPDMLAGAMDLHVVLPNGHDMKMSVERSTPMMDLLVQVTTANKISPGGHVIQAIGDRGILPYKPSTPIGALDTWTIHIVSKKQMGNMYLKKPLPKPANHNTPFELTFRLQVNLPRNQLYVSRVSYKTRLEDILCEVCKEKNLDQTKYCLIHPDKLDEELDLSKTFLDYKLQQVTLTSKSNRPVGLSSVDIMALKRYDNNGHQHVNNKYYASHSYDGSVSSGSIEGRSLSPVRSDESSSSPTIPKTNTLLNRPFRKRRPAPKPPSVQNGRESKQVPESLTISHSRNSSDSSGYHESSVLSESPESNSNSLADSLPRRSKLPSENPSCSTQHSKPTSSNGKIGSNLSRSLSNLAVIGGGKKSTTNMLSNGMRRKEYSASSTSLASIPGKKKKAPAPPPPLSSKSLLSLKEEDVSEFVPPPAPVVPASKSQTLPATARPPHNAEPPSSNCRLQDPAPEPVSACTVASCSVEPSPPSVDVVDSAVSAKPAPDAMRTNSPKLKEKELTMDDEEIDRIFNDATKDYESLPLSTLPSPPESFTNSQLIKNESSLEDPYCWEYKLPSPPQAFRDQTSSPTVTEYDTVTISNLTDVVSAKRLSADEIDRADLITKNVKHSLYSHEFGGPAQPKSCNKVTLNANSCSVDQPTRLAGQAPSSSTVAPASTPFDASVSHTRLNGYAEPAVDQSKSGRHSPERDSRAGRADSCEKLNLSCDRSSSSFVDVHYMSTNDSGLGSDDSIPSVSEGRGGDETAGYARKTSVDGRAAAERRGSTLQNFTITTYQHSNSKPTEIFHDDSVKTSRTTLLAKNNRPFAKASDEHAAGPAAGKSSALIRHSSFNTEKAPNSMVKRSKSHISLLSGNFTRFNRLGKFNVRPYVEEADSGSSSPEPADQWVEPGKPKTKTMPNAITQLRRTISEVSINKDSNKDGDELLELQDQVLKWKENEKNSCFLPNGVTGKVSELQSLQVLKDILPQINRQQLPEKSISSANSTRTNSVDETSSTNRFKVEIKPRPSIDQHGAPAVNLQSWNERPKRQVSIKTDRDYVFGNQRRCADRHRDDSRNGQPDTATAAATGRVKSAVDDLSRVPIVRAVEFKKPFAQTTTVAVAAAAAKPSAEVVRPESRHADKEVTSVEPKPRPSSFYLFGEHMLAGGEPRGLQRATSELEVAAGSDGGRVSLPHAAANMANSSAAPFKRASVTHVNGSGCAPPRFGYATTASNGSEACRVENYTFKTYKNKLAAESERLNNGFGGRMNGECPKGGDERLGGRLSATVKWNEPETKTRCTVGGGIPPPPPVMPTLRPVGQKSGKTGHCENQRDVLLSSIKNFNRDNLRKLRMK